MDGFYNVSVPLSSLKTRGDEFVHVLMIATLEENNYSQLSLKILAQLSNLIKSVLQHSVGTALHIIIVTDENSKNQIRWTDSASFSIYLDKYFSSSYVSIDILLRRLSGSTYLSSLSWTTIATNIFSRNWRLNSLHWKIFWTKTGTELTWKVSIEINFPWILIQSSRPILTEWRHINLSHAQCARYTVWLKMILMIPVDEETLWRHSERGSSFCKKRGWDKWRENDFCQHREVSRGPVLHRPLLPHRDPGEHQESHCYWHRPGL